MSTLGILFNILAPIDSFSVEFGGVRVYFAWIICLILDVGGSTLIFAGVWKVSRSTAKTLLPFFIFLGIGLFSVLTSPYRATSALRGFEQAAGICMMLLMVVCYDNMVRKEPRLLCRFITASCCILGVIGHVALLQFIVNNTLNDHVVNFRFLALLLGNTSDAMDYGMMGPFWRSNSFLFEGDNLALYSTVMLGLVWIRLGILGPELKLASKNVVPGWSAWGMAAGIATAMSATGYADFILVLVSTIIVARGTVPRKAKVKKPRRSLVQALGRWAVVLLVCVVPLVAGEHVVEKYANLGSLGDVIAGTETDREHGANGDIMGLAANLVITVQNLQERPLEGAGLGAHPASYDAHQPDFLRIFPAVIGQNKDDASCLLLRVLSETGLLGAFFFTIGWFLVILRGWRTAKAFAREAALTGRETPNHVIAIGMTASTFAMISFYTVKAGFYFDANLWLSIALTTSVSSLSMLRSTELPKGLSLNPIPSRLAVQKPGP